MSKRLRCLVLTTLAITAGAGAAAAADLDGPPRRQAYPAPVDYGPAIGPWTGFYVGATLGYGWGDGRADGDIGAIPFEQSGMLGTVFAGYNWQVGRAVLGVEADVGTGDYGSSEPTVFGTLESSLVAMGSLRGRAGFLLSPAMLVYGTAGLAWANMDFGLAGDETRKETFMGYQVGVGTEYMISPNMTFRVEYLYTGFDSERIIHSGLANSFEPDINTVRAGLSFKF